MCKYQSINFLYHFMKVDKSEFDNKFDMQKGGLLVKTPTKGE